MNLGEFIQDRNAALLSLDREKLLKFFRKYKIAAPEDPTAFWGGVHKARLGLAKVMSAEEIEKSRAWLRSNGMSEGVEPAPAEGVLP